MGERGWRLKPRLRAFRHQVPLQGLPTPYRRSGGNLGTHPACQGVDGNPRRRVW
jgi:hypothetical protein